MKRFAATLLLLSFASYALATPSNLRGDPSPHQSEALGFSDWFYAVSSALGLGGGDAEGAEAGLEALTLPIQLPVAFAVTSVLMLGLMLAEAGLAMLVERAAEDEAQGGRQRRMR